MEVIPLLIGFVIKTMILAFGLILIYKGAKKNIKLIHGILLSIVFVLIYLFQIFDFSIIPNPEQDEIYGKYLVSNSSIFDFGSTNGFIELKENGKFTFNNRIGIGLCENGLFEVDFEFEGNEISFKCGEGWRAAHFEKGLWSHKIVFYTDSEMHNSIEFTKKIETKVEESVSAGVEKYFECFEIE